ncbi:TIGR03943 family putative permease subunit [Acetivibrio cellulolyticus]|uniref:TIGR03943 family putative permease subunit n=1 Tax=Acetivibrio cellulolyticus TaxID=35830 RepID=UPI0001E2EBAA|nr:hypothetical protein [Acetivibrio cellulolyticus]
MKKIFIFTLFILIIFLAGCNKKPLLSEPSTTSIAEEQTDKSAVVSTPEDQTNSSGNVVKISERFFIQQCNDIYTNLNDYKGKTIQLEGMYDSYTDEETGKTRHAVIRKSPGCCGNDGVVGFEFSYDGQMPKLNEWIKVTGTLEVEESEDIILHLSKLEVLEIRGKEFVTN